MSDFRLTVVAIFALYFLMDGTSGMIYLNSRSFPYLVPQPSNSEQENTNADFHMPPYLPFFSSFRRQIPFLHVPLEGMETTDDALSGEKNVESKINNTWLNKTKEVANPGKNQISDVPQYFEKNLEKKSLLEAFPLYHFRHWRIAETKAPGLKKRDDQPVISATTDAFNNTAKKEKNKLEEQGHGVFKKVINPNREGDRYDLVGKYPLGKLLNIRFWRNEKKGEQEEKQAQNTTHMLNDTMGIAANNSLLMDAENCTRRQLISRYFFIWTINWASLITHLTVIVLITALITCGLLMCRPYFENAKQVSKLYKVEVSRLALGVKT